MIREGALTAPSTTGVELLTATQFSTITEARMFVVRAVSTAAAIGTDGVGVTYSFRRGSDRLSQGTLGSVALGIPNAEDAEIFRGMIDPGNLYLEVTGAATSYVHFDITAY